MKDVMEGCGTTEAGTANQPTGAERFVMRRGAVAMLDILGFRGIWGRHDAAAVVARLERLAEVIAQWVREWNEHASAREDTFLASVHHAFLSDTVVIGVCPKPTERLNGERFAASTGLEFTDDNVASEAVRIAALLVAELMWDGLTGEPAFAFRGCIAFGDFGMTDRFILGEAVDLAAEGMNRAHGAIVWLKPSADKYKEPVVWALDYPLMTYDVPTKTDSATISAKTVVPFAEGHAGIDTLVGLYSSVLVTTDLAVKVDVEEKRANTISFLRTAKACGVDAMRRRLEESSGGIVLMWGPYPATGRQWWSTRVTLPDGSRVVVPLDPEITRQDVERAWAAARLVADELRRRGVRRSTDGGQ